MKVRTTLSVAVALAFLAPVFGFQEVARAETRPQQAATQEPQTAAPPATSQTTLPPQAAQPQGAAPLRVMVDKSLLINTTEQIKRISVTDPSVADPTVLTPTQILVHGRAPGEVSLIIWDELERSRSLIFGSTWT